MRKLSIIFAFLLSYMGGVNSAWADELTVHDGTTTNDYVPIAGYYGDCFTKCEYIIPASELSSISGTTITGLKLYQQTAASKNTGATYKVFLKSAESTSISNFSGYEDNDVVYTGTISMADNAIVTITFDEDYIYEGGNLLVGIYTTERGSATNYGTGAFYGETVSGGCVHGFNSQAMSSVSATARNFIPKTTFVYSTSPYKKPYGVSISNITATSATVSWTPRGEEASFDVCYSTTELEDPATGAYFETGVTGTSYNMTGLSEGSTYYVYVRGNYGGGNYSDWTSAVSFKASNEQVLTVNNGTGTSFYIPIYYTYVASNTAKSQFIIPASEISSMQSRQITKLTFYANQTSRSFGNAEFKVYLKEVENTSFESAAFYDWNDMDAVYTGTLTVSDGQMEITFDNSFDYSGGNLMVGIQQVVAGANPSSFSWYGVTGSTYGSVYQAYSISRGQFVPKITFVTMPESPYKKPHNLSIALTSTGATLTWEAGNDEASWDVVYSSNASADPNSLTAETVNSATYHITGLTLGSSYYVWVRSNYGNETSGWISKSFFYGYTTPAPSSVDGDGITNVTFGSGNEIVNNSERPTSSPFYGDYSSQAGAYAPGDEATVAITYNTGYTYGTIIWVDWNGNMNFEGNEVVYAGVSTSSKPTTLNATFTVPASQTEGNYRMRIAGADSFYDSYTSSIAAAASASPTPTGTYTVVHDYTLHVVSGSTPITPTLSVSENTLAFGTVNTSTDDTFTVTSNVDGLATIAINGEGAAAFSVSPSINLTANTAETVTVTFNPATEGTYSAILTVTVGELSEDIALSGTYTAPTPASTWPETFDGMNTVEQSDIATYLNGKGWTDTEEGRWTYYKYSNDIIGIYDYAGSNLSNTYLITPKLTSTSTNNKLVIKGWDNDNDDSVLKVYISEDGINWGSAIDDHSTDMNSANFGTESTFTTTIPEGNYFVRIECLCVYITEVSGLALAPAATILDQNTANTITTGVQDITLNYVFSKAAGRNYNTIAVPFEITDLSIFGEGVKAYTLQSYDEANSNVTFSEVETLEAGKPYMLHADTPTSESTFNFYNVDVTSVDEGETAITGVTFHANYSYKAAGDISGEWYGVNSTTGNVQKAGTTTHLLAFRGYFTFDGSVDPARLNVTFLDNDGGATSINGAEVFNNLTGDIYDLSGRKVLNAQKGIYIQNGKKYVVK